MAATMSHRLLYLIPALLLAACAGSGEKEMVPSEDTYQCQMQGQRLVIRFIESEARLLMPPNGERINLYQLSASGGVVRYSNGLLELRGSGTQLTLVKDGFAIELVKCEPLMVPKKSSNPFGNM
jgi:hypothetical protein